MVAINLMVGDITECDVDAIVNAANSDLVLGTGVSGSIKAKAGAIVQEQCLEAGPIPIGEAAITTAGTLKAKCIIHAASMSLGTRTTENSLINAINNALLRASEKEFSSIAFPAVGTGVGGLSLKACARIMLDCIYNFGKSHSYPKEVNIVLFDEEALQSFNEVFVQMNA